MWRGSRRGEEKERKKGGRQRGLVKRSRRRKWNIEEVGKSRDRF